MPATRNEDGLIAPAKIWTMSADASASGALPEGRGMRVLLIEDDAILGEAVRDHVAAGGHAVLRHGRVEPVRLEEMEVEKRAPVLKEYLRRAPGARPHVPIEKDASLEEFERIAATFPVFRVLSAG